MSKVIFVLHRRADLTRDEMDGQWSGEQHTEIRNRVPGLIENRAHRTKEVNSDADVSLLRQRVAPSDLSAPAICGFTH